MKTDAFLVTHTLCPMYSVKAYSDDLFRVVKHKHTWISKGARKTCEDDARELPDTKFASALSRAKTSAREYGLCNRWEYFVTLTLDKEKVDRYDLCAFLKELMQWIQNLNKKGSDIKYLLIPEQHQDGAWHLHGLMSGIEESPQPAGTPRSIVDTGFGCWLPFSERYGFSTVSKVISNVGCGFYITKYITKSLADLASMKGIHCYYHSRGLRKSLLVGYRYTNSDFLSRCARFESKFCDFGFFKVSDIDNVASLLDEFGENYQRYVFTDPATEEVIAVSNEPSTFWDLILGDQLELFE